jgi:hypothetical protein
LDCFFQEFVDFLETNKHNLAKLRKLDLCFDPDLPDGMTSKSFLALLTFSNVKEIKNFGPFIFDDKDMVILL